MKHRKLFIFASAAVFLFVCDRIFGWSAFLTSQQAQTALRSLLDENIALAMGLYVLLTVAGCVLLALPGVTFAIVAGLLFGPVWGTLACATSATVGACLSFLLGRYFLKDALKPKLQKNPHLNRLLFSSNGHSDVFLLAVTRLVPLFPYNLQNFAYGITDMKFLPYALYSALFMLPGTAVYTIGAAGFLDPQKRIPCLLCAGALLFVVLLVSRKLKRSVAEK